MTSLARRLLGAAPAIFAVVTLPAVALASVLVGSQAAAVVAILGWFLLTPLSAVINEEVLGIEDGGDEDVERVVEAWTEWREGGDESGGANDPLERLRERYAEGEIDEAEFERRLDLLLDTEDADPETARDRVRERSDEWVSEGSGRND